MKVREVRFHQLPLETRFPFRYGIASMTAAPHLFVHAVCEFDTGVSSGVSADLLPPKWFTKNPETTFEEDDLPAMLRVIKQAAEEAIAIEDQQSVFCWWRQLHARQMQWGAAQQLAPLLVGFGVSLLERAVLDAFCRHQETPLHRVLRENRIGVDLGAIRPTVAGVSPADVLGAQPTDRLAVRHTVGLGDPLTDADIAAEELVDDGLPQSLEANIREYGLRFFKIKLRGDLDADRQRLEQLASLFERTVGPQVRITVDGNENYQDVASFREHWQAHAAQPTLQRLLTESLLMVEQPIHRDMALEDEVGAELRRWEGAPPIIIDESDGDLDCAPRAFELGYSGVSHKNCKGVIKSLANAAEAARLRSQGRKMLVSAEDLANYGPVALLQDLAVASALGVEHIERNGHHYFAGLSGLPDAEQQRVLDAQPDIYARHAQGFAALSIHGGCLSCNSINQAPFGYISRLDLNNFAEWTW